MCEFTTCTVCNNDFPGTNPEKVCGRCAALDAVFAAIAQDETDYAARIQQHASEQDQC